MKDLDKFSDEEKKHLSYLGSKLRKEPVSDFDIELQRLFDERYEYDREHESASKETEETPEKN